MTSSSAIVDELPVTTVGRCRGCGYSLQGLPTARCPECGRDFDPNDPATMDFWRPSIAIRIARASWRWIRPVRTLAICVALAWFGYQYHEGLFTELALLPIFYLLYRRRWIALPLFLLLNPFTYLLVSDAHEYVVGSYRYTNYDNTVWTPQGSVNPITRVRGHNPGCGTHSANYWVQKLAQDTAAKVMFRLTGPPGGAYTGPYPTQAEAEVALKSGSDVKISDYGELRLMGTKYALQYDWIGYMQPRPMSEKSTDVVQQRAVLWKGSVLIIGVHHEATEGSYSQIFLIDTVKMEMFAMYDPED